MAMKKNILFAIVSLFSIAIKGQVVYPYSVDSISLINDGRKCYMAYMDIKPPQPSGKNILLLHGKNFNGYCWKNILPFLTGLGYRVIIPDQVGWGMSSHPDIHYSFQLLASNTKQLLDSLGIQRTIVLGHSMGGMLASRFVLMFPGTTEKLILENPIGLEDYKTFVPYKKLEELYAAERSATYASYKKYQQSYYPEWKPRYEQYVQAQAADLSRPDFDSIALTNAITYQMIIEQPVVYELNRITVPTLLVIGQADRTVVGKAYLAEAQQKLYGQYPALGRATQKRIKNSLLVEIPGVGHIPHIQATEQFEKSIRNFITHP